MAQYETRLTKLSHGGGCGCKLSPAMLRELLSGVPEAAHFPDLLVGTETGDDAAVFRIAPDQAVVSTTDFFMPIVDDPYDFGRIAAANALSDVYAMGGRPIMALAILGMPLDRIAPEAVSAILAGGAAICAEAGIPIGGGHSIDAPEPIYGLAVTGLVHPERIMRNSGAKAGDALILTKPLGVGILSAALKGGELDAEAHQAGYGALVTSAIQLNKVGPDLAAIEGVHAITDVTGFGLLGHGLEMCRGSGLGAQIAFDAVPLLDGVAEMARGGIRTGASGRNWASYGADVDLGTHLAEWQRDLLTDPQTSGGLLVAVSQGSVAEAMDCIGKAGFDHAAVIGEMTTGAARISAA